MRKDYLLDEGEHSHPGMAVLWRGNVQEIIFYGQLRYFVPFVGMSYYDSPQSADCGYGLQILTSLGDREIEVGEIHHDFFVTFWGIRAPRDFSTFYCAARLLTQIKSIDLGTLASLWSAIHYGRGDHFKSVAFRKENDFYSLLTRYKDIVADELPAVVAGLCGKHDWITLPAQRAAA